jgi:hypothetical protein
MKNKTALSKVINLKKVKNQDLEQQQNRIVDF